MARLGRKAAAIGAATLGVLPLLGTTSAGAALPSMYVLTLPQAEATGYVLPSVTVLKGQPLTYLNLDQIPHTVTSLEVTKKTIKVGKKTYTTKVPLFDTRIVSSYKTAVVPNVASLPKGTYHFICTLHVSMKGTLTVQ